MAGLTREYRLVEIDDVARALLAEHPGARVWALHGELGAGKTTLVQALCRQLGVESDIASPTFALVNTYRGGLYTVHHVDCYRLETLQEAVDAGFEDYLQPGAFVFVEWPERVAPLLPPETLHLYLRAAGDAADRRQIAENG